MNYCFVFKRGESVPFDYTVLHEKGHEAGSVKYIRQSTTGEIYEVLFNDFLGASYWRLQDCDWTIREVDRMKRCVISRELGFITYLSYKNATNSIFSLFYDDVGNSTGPFMWNRSGELKNEGKFLDYTEIKYTVDTSKYLKFFIWRDPIDRFISMCNFTRGNIRLAGPHGIEPNSTDAFEIIENYLTLLELLNANKSPITGNGHIKLQSANYYYLEEGDVDFMVDIGDFALFAKDKLGKEIKRLNESSHIISADDISVLQRERLKKLVQPDYRFYERFKEKLYIP